MVVRVVERVSTGNNTRVMMVWPLLSMSVRVLISNQIISDSEYAFLSIPRQCTNHFREALVYFGPWLLLYLTELLPSSSFAPSSHSRTPKTVHHYQNSMSYRDPCHPNDSFSFGTNFWSLTVTNCPDERKRPNHHHARELSGKL